MTRLAALSLAAVDAAAAAAVVPALAGPRSAGTEGLSAVPLLALAAGILGSGSLETSESSAAITRAPCALAGRIGEPVSGSARPRHCRELSEQVIGDVGTLIGGDVGLRAERVESGERPLANRGAIDREQLCDVVVRATPLQHELKDGALVGGQAIERSHRVA